MALLVLEGPAERFLVLAQGLLRRADIVLATEPQENGPQSFRQGNHGRGAASFR
jgi:hypothetical protein